jgi:hypothetical protein
VYSLAKRVTGHNVLYSFYRLVLLSVLCDFGYMCVEGQQNGVLVAAYLFLVRVVMFVVLNAFELLSSKRVI